MSLESAIAETQQVLKPLFTKPGLTEKYLSRPPFRFLHDVVTATLRETGFPSNFFSNEEFDASSFEDKNRKIAFLEKLIALVSICHGQAIDVRASKIVAGQEPINTNALLVAFGKAATDPNLDRQQAVENCLAGKSFKQVPVPRLERRSPDEKRKTSVTGAIEQEDPVVPLSGKSTGGQIDTFTAGSIIDVGDKQVSEDREEDLTNSITRSSGDPVDRQPTAELALSEMISQSNGDLVRTREMIEIIVTKPRCSEKLLERPPFAFLHDLIIAIVNATNYGKGVFDEHETDSAAFKDKASKISFLEKIINHVQLTLCISVDAKAGKIVAGLEGENTRHFLQLLAVAATSSNIQTSSLQIQVQSESSFKDTMNNEGSEESRPRAGKNEEEPVLVNTSPNIAVEGGRQMNEDQSARKVSEGNHFVPTTQSDEATTSVESTNVSAQVGIDRLRERAAACTGDIAETRQMIESVVMKPRCSEKLLDRPPFRFVRDVIMSIGSATGYCLQNFSEQEINSENVSDKEGKIAFLEKIIGYVQTTTGLEIEALPTKVVSGLECEKTRRFLQLLVVAATANSVGGIASSGSFKNVNGYRNENEFSPSEKDRTTDEEQRLGEELNYHTLEKSREDNEMTISVVSQRIVEHAKIDISLPESQNSPSTNGNRSNQMQRSCNVSWDIHDSLKQRRKPTARNVQTLAARPGPPRTKRMHVNVEEEETRSSIVMPKIHILGDDCDDDEGDFPLDPALSWHKELVEASKSRSDTTNSGNPKEEHSALVRKIIQDEDVTKQTDFTEIASSEDNQGIRLRLKVGSSSGMPRQGGLPFSSSSDMSPNNVSILMKGVQILVRSVGPLGKCVENAKENLSQMVQERDFWVSKCRAQDESLEEAKKGTENFVSATSDTLQAVEGEIDNVTRLAEELKVKIYQNDRRVHQLLGSLSAH